MTGGTFKTGPAKAYSDAELARFAEFRQQRARFAPDQCDHGEVCWVAAGSPAMITNSKCLGCGGTPQGLSQRHSTRPRVRK